MSIKAKKKIVVETYQRQIIRLRRKSPGVFCEFCEGKTQMIELNEAALLLSVTILEVFRELESGNIHFSQTETGSLVVCLNSLLRLEQIGGAE